MNWYYERAGSEVGPLTDEQFQQEVRSGKVTRATLVWNETLPQWQPYASITEPGHAPSNVPTKICSQCKGSFPPDDLIQYSGYLVCSTCKPLFFQQLKETGRVQGQLQAESAPLYFPISTTKLIVLSLCTLGIYEVYWFYKNWMMIKDRTGRDIRPAWRAIFAIFFCHQLFTSVKESADSHGIQLGWKTGVVTLTFILLSIAWRLPEPFDLFSFLAFVPLLPVQATVNGINGKTAPYADKNDRFSGWNIVTVVLGGLLLLLAVIGTFLPAE